MAGNPVVISLLAAALLASGCGGRRSPAPVTPLATDDSVRVFDHHVHVMSPALLERWKEIGITFAKPDYGYSDIDSIIAFNPARGMFLLSGAYLFGSPAFSDSAELANVRRENDFVASLARRRPDSLYAFCSVNPLREYAEAEILRCRREIGVYGLKLHFAIPAVSLRDPAHLDRVRGIFSLAAGEGMPVVVHFDNETEEFGDEDARILIDSVLAPGPAMELFIAHLGTSSGYTHVTRTIAERFAEEFGNGARLAKHTIRFDLSAVPLAGDAPEGTGLTPDDFADLTGQLIRLGLGRVVFGTDYPAFNTVACLSTLESETAFTREELVSIARNGTPSGASKPAAARDD